MQALRQMAMLEDDAGEWRAARVPAKKESMEPRLHCAYNQTRECFLGLEIEVLDLTYAALFKRMNSVALKSGEGLWITPFHGIPTSGLPAPLDLIYLDEECQVFDIVESFPTFQISASGQRPASVLALPAHSIYSSQTQPGDQILLCVAEEMQARLEGSSGSKSPITVQNAVLLREAPLWSGGPGMVELESPATETQAGKEQRHQMNLVKPGNKSARAPKNWLERWWSPDPRKAPRETAPGIAAYYWNGAAPEAHGVRDISSTGIYVVTEERWYPGTLVLMTLQRTEDGEKTAERCISVLTRAVRWGQDGVGLQFVLDDGKDPKQARNELTIEGADRREFERFLQQLKKGK